MRIILPTKWKRTLADLPETSMGAQHIDITMRDGRVIRDIPVFNGDECQAKENFDVAQIADITLSQK